MHTVRNMRIATIIILLLGIIIPSPIHAQILDEGRQIDWENAGYPGGIPQITDQVNVLDFGAVGDGVADESQAIANAIVAAPTPGVVFFPEGRYRFEETIRPKEGIVIRGAGHDRTYLECDLGGGSTQCIEIVTYERGTYRAVLSGYQKGSMSVEVSDVSGFFVGGTMEIKQDNDPELMYTDPAWDVDWAKDSVGQFMRITAINGNQLTLDRPLHIDFREDLNPMIRPNGLITDVGIEDLHIRRINEVNGHTILIKNAADSWVLRVESEYTYRAHVSVTSSMNIEIRDSYFHHSHDYGVGGHGYGTDLGGHTTDCLVENNIFETLRHAMIVQVGANGNVFGYNYSIDPIAVENSVTRVSPDMSFHGHYPFMNLSEGNIVQRVGLSDYWGPAGPGNTLLRNRVETLNIELEDHSHDQNIIGNELTGGANRITMQAGITGVLIHGNNVNGEILWDPTIEDHQIPNSYYLRSRPAFFGDLPWPAMGGDKTLGAGTIPAKVRYQAGEPIPGEEPGPIFDDVPADHWARDYIELLYDAGFVSGCSSSPLMYCPDATMTRAESAVFVERGIHNADYMPQQPATPIFDDVPLDQWFAKWADGLWRDGYTAGCETDPLQFCPLSGHTRTEGTVFYLRMLNGPDFMPQDPVGIFTDVPIDFWGAKWIEAAYNAGLIPACDANPELRFCPDEPLTRAMAAYMMVQAKGLNR